MKIILMMAMTVDGIIARDSQHTADWTSSADKKAFIAETKKHGAIIMGETTFATIGRPLPGRLNFILSLSPEKFQEKTQPGTLEFFKGSPEEIVRHLSGRGFESVILGGGARTNAMFLKAGLVDELMITVEPKIFGAGLNFTEGEPLDLNLELIESRQLDTNVIQLHYRVTR
jgi:dihydrofolate reductase